MRETFHLGGWGMYPTFIFGLVLLAGSVRYATKPEQRVVPLLISLGILTLVSGATGFVTGLIKSLDFLNRAAPDDRFLALVGLGESLHNIALALVLVMLAALAAVVGTWRLARSVA